MSRLFLSAALLAGIASAWHVTPCGKTHGHLGPTQAQCDTEYKGKDAFLSGVTVHNGIQEFKVPVTGQYKIKAAGAGGGQRWHGEIFGRGAVVETTVELTAGESLWVLVGQKSDYYKNYDKNLPWIGGSGGTFVMKGASIATAEPLLVAGGGSGHRSMNKAGHDETMDASCTAFGKDASDSGGASATGGQGTEAATCITGEYLELGFGHGGCGGWGGQRGRAISGNHTAGGGAGYRGDGAVSTDARGGSAASAKSFRNGGVGGTYFTSHLNDENWINGGFGGGGSGSWGGAGGGGGYSGGGGDPNTGYGGGGSSFCHALAEATACNCVTGLSGGNVHAGYATIEGSASPSIETEVRACGLTHGHVGPTQTMCKEYYSTHPWLSTVTVHCDGIQELKAPTWGTYAFTAYGAGGAQDGNNEAFGRGAVVSGQFLLKRNQKLFMLVGQMSDYYEKYENEQEWIGGSGGTFISTCPDAEFANCTYANSIPLLVAGGGSGHRSLPDDKSLAAALVMDASCNTDAKDASGTGGDEAKDDCSTLETGFGHGGINGCGGQRGRAVTGNHTAGGGSGFFGNGAVSTDTRGGVPTESKSFRNCGRGGTYFTANLNDDNWINGGFGGGGSGSWGGTGGGGGFSGGGGDPNTGHGGGGGSFCNGASCSCAATHKGVGKVHVVGPPKCDAVDCTMSDWSPWSICTKTCASGSQSRSRSVAIPTFCGGNTCPHAAETRQCNIQACPVDCVVHDWGSWGTCDKSCKSDLATHGSDVQGVQTRSRTFVQPTYGGKSCPSPTHVQNCNSHYCAMDCTVAPWQAWSMCTKSCGGGSQNRARANTEPVFGGVACPHYRETRACNEHACPQDCVVNDWGTWETCSKSCGLPTAGGAGTQTRSRTFTQPVYGGASCPAATDTRECNAHACPVDCDIKDWGSWGACTRSCRETGQPLGQQVRFRELVQPKSGGSACPTNTEQRDCNDFACPVDCEVSQWGAWGACSLTCGQGQVERTRTVDVSPLNGGVACPSLKDVSGCNRGACPVHCIVSEFSEWTACTKSCKALKAVINGENVFRPPGSQSRSRSVLSYNQNGGYQCPYLSETRPCNDNACPIDCGISGWQVWQQCTKSCGTGSQNRQRIVTTLPQYGGEACPHSAETRECNTQGCPNDCAIGSWGGYTTCTKSCGRGSQSRTRTNQAPTLGGAACPHSAETRLCNIHACPVDCNVGDWSTWTLCSQTCTVENAASGTQYRTRTNVAPRYGGALCPAERDDRNCNTHACPVDCVEGPWTGYSTCTKSCGSGSQKRSRTLTAPLHGGKACAHSAETRLCNEHECPLDCDVQDWAPWATCTNSCDGGFQSRQRTIVEPLHGGKACPHSAETRSCNTHSCPIDCKYGAQGTDTPLASWRPWTTCTESCSATCESLGSTATQSDCVAAQAEDGSTPCEWHYLDQPTNSMGVCRTKAGVDGIEKHGGYARVQVGSRTRERTIQQPEFGGKACEASVATEACPVGASWTTTDATQTSHNECTVDCHVSAWQPWQTCSKSCDDLNTASTWYDEQGTPRSCGKQVRVRTVDVAAKFGGAACPKTWKNSETLDQRACNVHACPIFYDGVVKTSDLVASAQNESLALGGHVLDGRESKTMTNYERKRLNKEHNAGNSENGIHGPALNWNFVSSNFHICEHTKCMVQDGQTYIQDWHAKEYKLGEKHHCVSQVEFKHCVCICSKMFKESKVVHNINGAQFKKEISISSGKLAVDHDDRTCVTQSSKASCEAATLTGPGACKWETDVGEALWQQDDDACKSKTTGSACVQTDPGFLKSIGMHARCLWEPSRAAGARCFMPKCIKVHEKDRR